MSMNNDYVPVSLSLLKVGMKIDYSIYRENNREFSLLCKNVILTEELLDKFNKLTFPTREIYVPNSKYEELIDDRRNQHNKIKKKSFFKHYDQAKKNAEKMMAKIAIDDKIPVEIADDLTSTVHKQVETMEISHIIQGINSVRKLDQQLHNHCVNVALLNGIIGRWLKLDSHSLAGLVKVGLLHDIGKLKIPQKILNKPARLTEEEFDLIMNHPIYSHELMVRSGFTDERILKGVIQHHERVNGLGYPFGLNIGAITDYAKITSIADVYDAMVRKRAYKEAHSPFEILSWFAEGCYSELDLNYVTVFLESMVDEFKGKKVMLSDGRVATVLFVHAMNFAYPIVQTDNGVVHTTAELKCVSLFDDDD